MKCEKVLLTGSSGFIGAHIKNSLEHAGIEVVGIDTSNSSTLGSAIYADEATFSTFLTQNQINNNNSVILHFGANSNASLRNFDSFRFQNVEFSRILFQSSLKLGLHVVFASSAAVYGNFFSIPNENRILALSPYARSKFLSEIDLCTLKNRLGMSSTILRLFNVYGSNETRKGSMMSIPSRFTIDAKKKGMIEIWNLPDSDHSFGKQARDFVSVDHLVGVIRLLLSNPADFDGIFDLGAGVARTFIDVARIVQEISTCEIKMIDPPPSYKESNYQTFTKAGIHSRNLGDLICSPSFEENLKTLAHHY